MNKFSWFLWALLSVMLASYFSYTLFISTDKSTFLIGETSYGHYQIELACNSCHTDAFGGPEIIQQACVNCHGDELKQAHDSHPRKKFTDPREAYRLEIIDARYCVSCHTEHKPEQTHAMGVTLPDDYCFHCHAEIGNDRKSHQDLPFDSCASAGCHNFHDNRALYESFLVNNANQPWLQEIAKIAAASSAHYFSPTNKSSNPEHDAHKMQQHPEITKQWQHSAHANAQVSCTACHTENNSEVWVEQPQLSQCKVCHQQETKGFLSGKHGMRLSGTNKPKLAPISPIDSPLTFKSSAINEQHGCNSCHLSHSYNTQSAAVDACVRCHDDEHSKNYFSSPHGNLWSQALTGKYR
ncbi:cytochrome c3 family protein [Oceanicoccus sp. KOV_DT_Chl]|uniref:cytochrome c3 family protein n=1 Tax=Oceanicoccus sp. KOV_DT_Chl TaxID=1904639 RepID=UPI000C798B7A|nr:cytochrome c3 family protein [Oceanicoccus sp. KOV_DT_Chl]